MTDSVDTSCPDSAGRAVDATALARRFGEIDAVAGVDLSIEAGVVYGLVGPDGAGKSTLIRMLATVLAPTDGEACVFGESVTSGAKRVRPRIGYMAQGFGLYPDLTVLENLRFFAALRGVPRAEIRPKADRLLEFSGLTQFAGRQAQYLSGGMKQKLALAVTLVHDPDLLLLDEPTTGVDPVSRREFWRIIAGLHQRGITVFVATPYMEEAELCTTVAFMDEGRILLEGSPDELKRRVPGLLVEIESADERAALDAVRSVDGVISAVVQGDLVRAIVSPDGPEPADLAAAVSSAGVEVLRVDLGRIDMEATFAHIVDDLRAGRG